MVPETNVYILFLSPLEAEQMSRQMALLTRISPELDLSACDAIPLIAFYPLELEEEIGRADRILLKCLLSNRFIRS